MFYVAIILLKKVSKFTSANSKAAASNISASVQTFDLGPMSLQNIRSISIDHFQLSFLIIDVLM